MPPARRLVSVEPCACARPHPHRHLGRHFVFSAAVPCAQYWTRGRACGLARRVVVGTGERHALYLVRFFLILLGFRGKLFADAGSRGRRAAARRRRAPAHAHASSRQARGRAPAPARRAAPAARRRVLVFAPLYNHHAHTRHTPGAGGGVRGPGYWMWPWAWQWSLGVTVSEPPPCHPPPHCHIPRHFTHYKKWRDCESPSATNTALRQAHLPMRVLLPSEMPSSFISSFSASIASRYGDR